PHALYPQRAARASARRSGRRPGPGPFPGLRDVPPDGSRAEAPGPDPSLHVSSSGATAGIGDSIASHRRGSVGHGAPFALRGDGGELAPDSPEEERRGSVREPERGGRRQLPTPGHHPRVLSDEDPPP